MEDLTDSWPSPRCLGSVWTSRCYLIVSFSREETHIYHLQRSCFAFILHPRFLNHRETPLWSMRDGIILARDLSVPCDKDKTNAGVFFFFLMFKLILHDTETDLLLRIYETSHSPASVLPYLSFPSIPGSCSVLPTQAWEGTLSHFSTRPLHSTLCLRLIHEFKKTATKKNFLSPSKSKKIQKSIYILHQHGLVTVSLSLLT